MQIEINNLATLLAALIAAIVGIISYFKGHTAGLAKGKTVGYSMGRIDRIQAQMSTDRADNIGGARALSNKVRAAVNKNKKNKKK